MIGDRGIERFVRWKRLAGPAILIPTATDDPSTGCRFVRALCRTSDDLFVTTDIDEADEA